MVMRAYVDPGSVLFFACRELRVSFHLSGERNYQFSGNFKTRVLSLLPAEDRPEENSALVGYCLGE